MATNPYQLPDPNLLDPTKPPELPDATKATAYPTATMPGTQNTQATPPAPQAPMPTGYTPATATAGNRTVGEKETVAGQLQGILSSGSPLLQQAQTRATQAMNKRGLINSSMAVGAGEEALYSAALPIAGADATTYRGAADMDYATKADTSKFNAGESNKGTSLQAELQNRERIATLDATTRKEIAGMEAGYKTMIQTNQTAGEVFQQAMKNIADIQMSDKLDGPNKQAAINNQVATLKTQMEFIGAINGLDIAGLLNFSGAGVASVGSAAAGGIASSTGGTTAPGETPTAPKYTEQQTADAIAEYNSVKSGFDGMAWMKDSTETTKKAYYAQVLPKANAFNAAYDVMIAKGASPVDAIAEAKRVTGYQ